MAKSGASAEVAKNIEEAKSTNRSAARLTVVHPDEGDYTNRTIHLSLDGRKFTSLKSGDTISLEIKQGTHILQADNTLIKKKVTFEVRAGEEARFVTRNRTGFGSSLIGIFGSGPLYLVLKRENDDS
jgi:hypothetical protein